MSADGPILSALHPAVARWFRDRYPSLSPAQRLAVPRLLARRTTLVCSPTGSGKTLAAFLAVFDALARARDAGDLPDGPLAVYVSPLRALGYDLAKNLQGPLDALGWDWVRVASRTGDTPSAERARQRRRPPHVLITTPESLTVLLSQPAWLAAFRSARFLVIDEVHALAENKRGSLLMVAAERLEEAVAPGPPLVRIGLSATISPLDEAGRFLAGPDRPCDLVTVTDARPARLEVFSPLHRSPYPRAGHTAARILDELGGLIRSRRTTLVFTNTRSGAESTGHRLRQALPDLADRIEVHHASLDRAIRLEVEDRLKRGELRAVVCSTSLELGIDIGTIDTVVMVSAPRGVARALQRIGRSGHSMGESSHGVLVATNVNDLAECAVTARGMARRELEPLRFPENPADVLAQHLVALAAAGPRRLDDAFALFRRSHPFARLTRARFDRIVAYLEGGGRSLEGNYRRSFGKIVCGPDGEFAAASPRVVRDFQQNVGTIVTETLVPVRAGARTIGEVEESFLKGLRPGDVFVLQGRTYRLLEAGLLAARVVAAPSATPTVPRWNAGKMPLASGLADEIVRLRTALAGLLGPEPEHPEARAAAERWLVDAYSLSAANARALTRHFQLQASVSIIPTDACVLVEVSPEGDIHHHVFHTLIGRAANDALSRILARRVQARCGGNALVTIDDYGFLLSLRPFQCLDSADAWRELFRPEGAEADLAAALADSPLVRWQFRGTAQTGLMVPRRVLGQDRGRRALQWNAEILFDVLRRHEPDHPLLEEAYNEATHRFLDFPRAHAFLATCQTRPWTLRTLPQPSPFAFGIHVSRIKETLTLEDSETTLERLYHEMFGRHLDDAGAAD